MIKPNGAEGKKVCSDVQFLCTVFIRNFFHFYKLQSEDMRTLTGLILDIARFIPYADWIWWNSLRRRHGLKGRVG